MFSNVDVITVAKKVELENQLSMMDKEMDIIALQEAKPKHIRYERTLAEYKTDGYELIDINLLSTNGRHGLVMNITKMISYNTESFQSNCCECTGIEVKGRAVFGSSV